MKTVRPTFFGIGGAKLDGEVEAFLLKSGFPYAVGYGLTETSPLAGYSLKGWRSVGSFGYPVHNVNIKLIDVNPETGEGEVAIKGPNVMLGYYKDPKRTKSVFNNQEGVTESIVIERNGRLVALVQPCDGFIDWDAEGEDRIYEKVDAWKAKLLKKVNKNVNKTSQVSSIEVMKEPFEKTATMKIRRFKYKDSAPTVEAERAAEAGKDSKNTDSCLK
ncbi:MAG: AMP-binding protein [Candidatus Cryptobacteroides sp.]